MSKPVMISVSGIRGIVGEGLSPLLITEFAAAAGTLYGAGRVMVGRDSRITGEMVQSAVFAGLTAVGCNPVDLGVCSTPTVEMAVQHSDAVGGIVITASHNPVEWNALKLLTSEGLFLDEEQGAAVAGIVQRRGFAWAPWDGIGRVSEKTGASEEHVQAILSLPLIDAAAVRRRGFRVACDCVNGAGGTILPQLFEALGCTVFFLNREPTGRFSHTPEPVPEHLGDLCRLTVSEKADIGFAVDPDVDRCAIIDEEGVPWGEEYTVSFAAAHVLANMKGPVVVNMSTTRAVDDIAAAAGAVCHRTKVGEIHVAKKMLETGAVIGGEGNGGVILPALHAGRDAPLAIALTLQALTERRCTASAARGSLPGYAMAKEKLHIGDSDPDAIMETLRQRFSGERVSALDGLKIDFPDHWVHIRKSNTEPIIRVIAEAGTLNAARAACGEYIDAISALMTGDRNHS
ncbi:phosphoglucosamine mutase [bacterium]|nr:phosphoglucosamine mutase [bacterium]